MRRNHVTTHHRDRQNDEWVVDAPSDGRSTLQSGRKHFKVLDRELQHFMARVSALADLTTFNDQMEDPRLALEAEEIYREALLLRAELREGLATGEASREDVVEGIKDSWDRLCESFDDLKSRLHQDRPPRFHITTADSTEDDYLDPEKLGDDQLEDGFESDLPSRLEDRRIHRPRGGPKR